MADLPAAITVGYQNVRILVGKFNFQEDHGKYDDENAEICINASKNIREIVNTVIHEALHAVCHNYALRQICLGSNAEKEEAIVTVMANGLTQVFRDNPALLDWIRETLHNDVIL